jgi:protein-L-isoaspartate(D-aspartate) O-methyltransferase
MVEEHLQRRGILDGAVLDAFQKVRRHRFMPVAARRFAYEDQAQPIGHDQTVSQPYVVALAIASAGIRAGDRVLDVGTGSGYQAALLEALGANVYSVEILPELARRAQHTLHGEGYRRVQLRCGDGRQGWPEAAPFDAIVVAAAPRTLPPALLEQLAPDGRLVIPLGSARQELVVVRRTPTGFEQTKVSDVLFVPMSEAHHEGLTTD